MVINLMNRLAMMVLYQSNLKRRQLFKRKKVYNDIKYTKKNLLKLDIFTFCNQFLMFIVAATQLKEQDKEIYNDDCSLRYSNSFFIMDMNETEIIFYSALNKFEIISPSKTYTIYRNTKVPKVLQNTWEALSNDIKNKCLVIALDITNDLDSDHIDTIIEQSKERSQNEQ